MKQMLSVDELVDHMKRKGITFQNVSENEAKAFLRENSYYMKLAAYRSNYPKCTEGKRTGQYIKLDFSYLQELSELDTEVRYLILKMCLDIEHALKVKLVEAATSNPQEDGYQLVRKFIAQDDTMRVLRSIRGHKSGEYCKDLIHKYYPYFPVWVFVELISFGDLLYFCSFYQQLYGVQLTNHMLMNTVRDMRNAAAHSNCVLNKMTEKLEPTKQVNSEVSNFVKTMQDISKESRRNNLGCKFTYGIATLLYVYHELVAKSVQQDRYKEIKAFLEGRACQHGDYFATNTKIVATYHFVEKMIDNLQNQ